MSERRPSPPRSSPRSFVATLVPLGVAVVIVASTLVLWWAWQNPDVQRWKAEASPVWFFAAMAILPALGLPITPFYALAGAAFGTRIGLLGSAAALAANLTLSYAIARGPLRSWLTRLLRRFGYDLPDFDARTRSGFRFATMVKLAPGLPAFAKHYLLGVVGVPFPVYFLVSMAITGAYGAFVVILGESTFRHDLGRGTIAAAVLLVVGGWVWRRRSSSLRAGAAASAA